MRVLGLMSGTSADGVDAVLADFKGNPVHPKWKLIQSVSVPYASTLRRRIVDAGQNICLCSQEWLELGEAITEAQLDEQEGSDILMVKPGLAYMDIIYRLRQESELPIAAYNVSGEYSMVKAAASKGWINEKNIVLETLLSFKRAGADLILTYHACDAAQWLKDK